MNITINCRIDSNLHGLYICEEELQWSFRFINVYIFLLYRICEWIAQK